MIVEALTECADPEGAVPKELFAWMAAHYPLQTNFRPSASQALQKAFKRGRLEKRVNGKYRLNANWEGGNVKFNIVN
jgi:linker histone H1 and H5 family